MLGANFQPDVNMINSSMAMGKQIGNANSPFTGVNAALQNVLGKFNANLASQQEQVNKSALLKEQYGLMGENALAVAKAKAAASQPNPIPGMDNYDLTKPITVDVGGIPHFVQPIYKNGVIVGKKLQSSRAPTIFEGFGQEQGAAESDQDVAAKLEMLDALQAQLPQGL